MADAHNETPESLFELGKRFYLPASGAADPLLATHYFTQAAEAGYIPAQRVLGNCYLEGRLIPRDYGLARRWLTEAARQNDGQAAYSLATMYAQGLGMEPNWELAWKLLDMESSRGLAEAGALREHLLGELRREHPDFQKKLAEVEASRRLRYDRHRQRFIQPWETPGRPLEKDEFLLLLGLRLAAAAPERTLADLTALLNTYYDSQEVMYPQQG
jgi:hypothetical protein